MGFIFLITKFDKNVEIVNIKVFKEEKDHKLSDTNTSVTSGKVYIHKVTGIINSC